MLLCFWGYLLTDALMKCQFLSFLAAFAIVTHGHE